MTDSQATTVYETVSMTPEQITAANANYRAMGLSIVVIDISAFCGKLEKQSNGTWKRSQIRVPKSSDGTNPKQSAAAGAPGVHGK